MKTCGLAPVGSPRLTARSLREVGAWLALAVLAGALLGAASRIAMRMVAVEAGVTPGFSLGGSLEVVAFGIIVGAPSALVYWTARRNWPLPRWAGVVAGMLLCASLVLLEPPAARSALEATPDTPIVTALLFVMAFAVYGAALDVLWRWKARFGRIRLSANDA